MKRKIGYLLLVLILLLLIAGFYGINHFNNAFFKERSNYLEYTYESESIQFDWVANSKGSDGYLERQAAIIIPLKIQGLAHRFYMQFDTGSPHTYLYEKDLKSLCALGLEIEEVIKGDERFVKRLEFILDENLISASMIKIYPDYGHIFNAEDTISRIGIGTIGSDFLVNRITEIDFRNQQLQFYKERPESMNKFAEFTPFDFTGRRIMLPATIDDKQYELFYDSGCSAFGLITIKSRFDRYSDEGTEAIGYNAKSWKSSIPITSKISTKPFNVGSARLKLKRVSYVDMYTMVQPLVTPFTRIGGWLGNQPFNESTLILDTKTEEFIVINE